MSTFGRGQLAAAILDVLANAPESLTCGEIARQLNCKSPAVARSINRLLDLGFVQIHVPERVRGHRYAGRLYRITDTGRVRSGIKPDELVKNFLLGLPASGQSFTGEQISRTTQAPRHSVYRILAQMLEAGHVQLVEEPGSRSYRYYRLTSAGARHLVDS